MARKTPKFNLALTIILCIIFVAIGYVGGGYVYLFLKCKHEIKNIPVYTSGDLAFHFLELGNKYTGDCTYIKAGDVDILIDAGSATDSIPTITAYINPEPQDTPDGTPAPCKESLLPHRRYPVREVHILRVP